MKKGAVIIGNREVVKCANVQMCKCANWLIG